MMVMMIVHRGRMKKNDKAIRSIVVIDLLKLSLNHDHIYSSIYAVVVIDAVRGDFS